jgi:lipoprotein signal peptidase
VTRTLGFLLGAATLVATLDLTHKALAVSNRGGAVLAHDRSASYVAGLAALSLAWAGAIALVRSASIALTGGLVLGGAVGNLASFALWPSLPGVPDPLVTSGIAFNLADVSALVGLVLLVPAIVVFAARNRERLFEPL